MGDVRTVDVVAVTAARLTACTCGSRDEANRLHPGKHTTSCAKFKAASAALERAEAVNRLTGKDR